jgi:hypothetical protein
LQPGDFLEKAKTSAVARDWGKAEQTAQRTFRAGNNILSEREMVETRAHRFIQVH